MLIVLFYNICEIKLSVSESANLIVCEYNIFCEKAPMKAFSNSVKKFVKLYEDWRNIKKNANKTQEMFSVVDMIVWICQIEFLI